MSPALLAALRNQAAALRSVDNLQEMAARYSEDSYLYMLGLAHARLQATCRVLLAVAGESDLPFTLEVSRG